MTQLAVGDKREEADFEGVSDELMEARKAEFRMILLDEKTKIMNNVRRTLTQDMTIDVDDLPDEIDRASADSNQALAFRLRGRERGLLSKIEKSLVRLEEGEYWYCDDCEAWVGFQRLRARPVTTVCIQCKEKREQRERGFAHQ